MRKLCILLMLEWFGLRQILVKINIQLLSLNFTYSFWTLTNLLKVYVFFFFKNCALDLCAEDRLTRLIRTRNIYGISTPCQILSLYSRQQFWMREARLEHSTSTYISGEEHDVEWSSRESQTAVNAVETTEESWWRRQSGCSQVGK